MDILLVKILKIRILYDNQKFIDMKKILSTLLILLFMGVSFTGCEKIKSLADHEFDVELSGYLDLVVQAEGQLKSLDVAGHIDEEVSISPKSNPDVYEYWNEIKRFAINSCKLVCDNDGGLAGTELRNIVVTVDGVETAVFKINSWTIEYGATYNLTDSDSNYAKLVKMLDAGEPFDVRFEADCDVVGAHFGIEFLEDVHVTANPL